MWQIVSIATIVANIKIMLDIANLYILFVKTAKIVYFVIVKFVPSQPSQIKYLSFFQILH